VIYEHTSYRNFLKSVVAERITVNPAYSLRAFARRLGITQPFLTEIIKGRKNFSAEGALKVAKALELDPAQAEYFCLLVQLESAKDPHLKESTSEKLKQLNPRREVHDLSVEFFRLIADWYHLVIRNLADTSDFDWNPLSIAKRLGITRIEAEAAIERLLRLELIERDPKRPTRYRKTKDYILAQSAIPNQALRSFHRQMLGKAVESLETQTPQEKIVGSETFAFSPRQLKEANRIIENCFQQMIGLSKSNRSKTEVYHLGIQLFNVTREGK
jgi:uncharacterized protein (TIGR02147 family)